MVKRYDIRHCGLCDMCEIDERADGEYVEFHKYEEIRDMYLSLVEDIRALSDAAVQGQQNEG